MKSIAKSSQISAIKLLFFGQLRECVGCSGLDVEVSQPLTGEQLIARLVADQSDWATWFDDHNLLIAINHNMSSFDDLIQPGDEVAMFPPVTGG